MQEFLNQYPWIISLLQIWSLPWKGLGLWTAAKRGDKWWFIAMLLVHTVGILEIFYLLVIAKYKFPFLRREQRGK